MKKAGCKPSETLVKDRCIPTGVLNVIKYLTYKQLDEEKKGKKTKDPIWNHITSPDSSDEATTKNQKANWGRGIDTGIFPYVYAFSKIDSDILPVNSCQGHKGSKWALPFITLVVTDNTKRKKLKKIAKKYVDVIDDKGGLVTYKYKKKDYKIPILTLLCDTRNNKKIFYKIINELKK
jgi:hypothetical protein